MDQTGQEGVHCGVKTAGEREEVGTVSATGALPAVPLWTLPFVLLLLLGVLGYGNIYLLVPTLPWYVERLGGSQMELGVFMGVFSGVALLIRPGSGWLSDRIGTRITLLLGVGVLGAAGLLYLPAGSLGFALLVRGLHGVGWGLFSVAGAALAAELSPPSRRGAGLGIYGMSGGLALAMGPMLGSAIGGGYATFLVAAGAGALAVGLCGLLLSIGHQGRWETSESAGRASSVPGQAERGRGGALISHGALLPAGVLLIFMFTYGAVFTFVPVLTEQRHLGAAGWFFTPYAVALLTYRGFTGSLSDRHGRTAIAKPGMLLAAVGLAMLAFASDLPLLVLAALLYAGGMAAIQPVCLAWASDRAPTSERGAAIATAIAAQDLGISSGSLVAGLIADTAGLSSAFLVCTGLALFGFAVVAFVARPSGERPGQGAMRLPSR